MIVGNPFDSRMYLCVYAFTRERLSDAVTLLSRIYFLAGEVRATTDDDKLAAFGRGRDLGKLALEIAPRSEDAHVWYALNLGRWGQSKGMMRSLFLLPTIARSSTRSSRSTRARCAATRLPATSSSSCPGCSAAT